VGADLGVGEDRVRFADVPGDGDGPVMREKCPGVDEDDRITVEVDDSDVGVDLLGDLVNVRGRRQSATQVEELVDACAAKCVTARRRNARLARAPSTTNGAAWATSLATRRSTPKLSFPPNQLS
jgi:hypothetical protein